jgi:serine/threonine protein kinase
MPDLQPSDPRSLGDYLMLGRLGAGSQGVVYLAATPSGHRVAIKQLILGTENERNRRQFAKEVAAARLVAPFCTAQLIDIQLEGPTPYLVSEYIEGLSLQQKVAQDGPLTEGALQRLAVGTATALVAIHTAGVVHRDLKPANVMLSPEGPRVIDFGIARDLSAETTITARVFGTPVYMSPEQLNSEPVHAAADIFAWASVIIFAATGHPPFAADHIMAIAYRITTGDPTLTGVPAELLPLLRSCLDKDPGRRPTAHDVLAQLLGRGENDVADPAPLLALGNRVTKPSVPSPRPARRRTARRRTASERRAILAGVLVSVLAVAGWGVTRSGWHEGSADRTSSDQAAAPVSSYSGPTGQPSATHSADSTPTVSMSRGKATAPRIAVPPQTRITTQPSARKPSKSSTSKAKPKPSGLPPPVVGTGPIVGLAGKCLDIANARSDDGTIVQLVACNQSKAQIWTASRDGTIRALGKCLNVASGIVEINSCDETSDQIWRVASNTIINTGSGSCLSTLAGSSEERTPATVTACTGAQSQSWALQT